MITNKHITGIIIAITAVAVAVTLGAILFAGRLSELLGGKTISQDYETELFNTDEIISIDIQMDEEEWETMLSNAISEEYYVCDVVVNGETFTNVAIRPKGNTSLSNIAMDPDTDRYSIKLEFDHFTDGQTCFGLDKLILNNNYADATDMKEAIIYDMYQYLGADASLYNYAEVSVNGEYWGVYLALEGVEQSFMLRNYGTQDGELYKPDSMEMGEGGPGGGGPGGSDSDRPSFDFGEGGPGNFNPEDMGGGAAGGGRPGRPGSSDSDRPSFGSGEDGTGEFTPGDGQQPPDMGDFNSGEGRADGSGMPGMFSSFMSGNGADLNYIDDELDSYSTIWDGAITDTADADHRRVVNALKAISEGEDLEKYMDVDNILKYMAVHTFAVNNDSLSGNMAHNYYLYEYDGQLNIIPWDYNLSFGGMGGSGDATSVVNDAIDTPFDGTGFFDALLENEEYRARYHEYLRQLCEEYVDGGRFDEVYNRIRSQIDSLAETDPTAFYTYDEYLTAADLLYRTVKLRAESIEGQLSGVIPSTDDEQREDSSALIDASDIDVSAMGQMDMGGGRGDSDNSGDEHGSPGGT